MEQLEIYKNLSLNDLEDEVWVDAIGYDGIYQVSNLGRVKSLGRFVSNGMSERYVKERILRQCLDKQGRLSCVFSVSNKAQNINIQEIIYFSFNPKKQRKNKQVVAHLNKIQNDNRLCNLELMHISDSCKISFKLGNMKNPTLRGELKYTKENTIIKDGKKIKKCKVCLDFKDINLFAKNRNTCSKCRVIQNKNLVSYKSKYKKYNIGIKKEKTNYDIVFKNVISFIKKGFTISEALKKLEIHRGSFYRNISEIQKKELISIKLIENSYLYIKEY